MEWPKFERLYLEWFYGNSLGDNISLLAKLQSHSLINVCIYFFRKGFKIHVLLSRCKFYFQYIDEFPPSAINVSKQTLTL